MGAAGLGAQLGVEIHIAQLVEVPNSTAPGLRPNNANMQVIVGWERDVPLARGD